MNRPKDPVEALKEALAIEIDFSATAAEIEDRWRLACAVNQASKLFFEDELDGDQFIQFIESSGCGQYIDQYIDEVDGALEDIENETGYILY